ncbi:MAG: TetR/AcrR family transcriptional regulator [Tissierellia bacterium]|nr:TetR/AcrR family transcriptional regulator [Tissierellia bacterium]
MDDRNINTKERILSATIELYGAKGDITVREICDKAGVNIASINYYFGSKDNLLKEVEKHYSMLLFDMQKDIIMDELRPSKEKLIDWAEALMQFVLEYPALIMLVANLVLQDQSYSPEIIDKFLGSVETKENIQRTIYSLSDIEDREILDFKYMQLFSGVIGPIIFQMIPSIRDTDRVFIDLGDVGERGRYIDDLVETILKG